MLSAPGRLGAAVAEDLVINHDKSQNEGPDLVRAESGESMILWVGLVKES